MNETFDLQAFGKLVVKHMPGWTYKPPKEDGDSWNRMYATLSGPDGAEITLHVNAREGRISISGNYCRHNGNMWPSDNRQRPDNITVSLSREPAAVAKDIIRRYLPVYMEAYLKGKAQYEAHVAHENGRHALCKRLAKLCGLETRKDDTQVYHYANDKVTFDLRIDGPNDVKLEVSTLSEVQVTALVKVLLTFTKT